ncbi:MAG: efflux RND transporter periplasmic adaptor subunit [Phycisphaeraceae bacterium]|nr:efflux RND transporter periplasmic adaptor subunit [Phycisphaerales bacterium]MCB9859551.1 efflux RND transporter periplasmic adaptor subunit [Phycisphaeraceae bacterium]
MLKWLIGIAVVCLLFVGGGIAFVISQGGPEGIAKKFQKEKEPTRVIVEDAERGDLVRMVSAPGTIEPDVKVNIGAQVSAKVLALPFKEGDDVKAGDVLARLDAEDLQARLDAAESRLRGQEASLAGAEASLTLAKSVLDTTLDLYETKDVPGTDVDNAQARYDQALATIEQIKSSIDGAKADIAERKRDLANAVITSPIDGTVVRINTEVGEQVLGTFNNQGSVLMQIADLKSMIVRARIDEANIEQVKEGQDVTVYLNAFPDRTFEGHVSLVKLERQIYRDGTAYIEAEVTLKLEEGDRFPTGLAANADIHAETLFDVIKVQTQSVLDVRIDELPEDVLKNATHIDRTRTFTHAVFVMENGKAKRRPVVIGASDLTHTVIKAGLEQGDRVVVGPYKALLNLKHDEDIRERGVEDEKSPADDQPSELAANGNTESTPK